MRRRITPEQTLTSSRESDLFLIDNTAPEISGADRTAQGGKIDVRFHAKDALSVLDKAEYSVNGGDWKVVEPTTRLTDSQEHDYRFQVDGGAGRSHHRRARVRRLREPGRRQDGSQIGARPATLRRRRFAVPRCAQGL